MYKLTDMNKERFRINKVVKDCDFDWFYLLGKPMTENIKPITYMESSGYIDSFLEYDVAGVICTHEIADALSDRYAGGIAISDEPKTSFFEIYNFVAEEDAAVEPNRISDSAVIHPTAVIEPDGVIIGDRTIIKAGSVIKSGSVIGDDCIIGEGCVVGAPAFYYFGNEDRRTLVTSTGTAELGNNVELHTHVTVEKGALGGSTVIGKNTKIDNNCLIGHDSNIGSNSTIAGGSTLAGGVVLGENSFLGVGVTIAPYVTCGDSIKLSSGSVATKDIPTGMHASGNFAVPHDKFISHIKELSK